MLYLLPLGTLTRLNGNSLNANESKLLNIIYTNFEAKFNGFLDSIHKLI